MTTKKSSLSRARQLGIGLTLIALALGGCGGKGSTPSNTAVVPTNPNTNTPVVTPPATIPTAAIKITPMKGQFSAGTSVKVKRAKDSVVVGTCAVDATGSCSANIATTETGPFLIEAGVAGDTYFDESDGVMATVPANTIALRALIPNTTKAIGVTALTEMAVGQIEAHTGGIAATKATEVIAANATIGSQFGVPNPLIPPAVIGATTSTSKLTGNNKSDDYALKLAGIAKMTVPGGDAIQAMHDLRDDIKDGKFDGQIGTTPIASLAFTVPAGGMTSAQLSLQMATQVAAATATYATPGVGVPTVTLTVADLAALLDAAMKVGAATQAASGGTTMTPETLNEQIANTVQAQVEAINTAVAGGSTVVAETPAAVAAGGAAGTVLANSGNAATQFLAAAATGLYQVNLNLNAAAGTQLNSGNVRKMTLTPNGAIHNYSEVIQRYNGAGWAMQPATAAGTLWDLTPTSSGGWVDTSAGAMNFSVAADGTFTGSNLSANGSMGDSFSMLIEQVALSGLPVEGCDAYAVGGPIPCTVAPYGTALYPAGSKGFRFTNQFRNNNVYSVDLNQGASPATDMNGVALTALPALGTSFCMTNQGGAALYQPVAGAAISSYTQAWIGAGGCTVANIATAKAQGGMPVSVFVKATGNPAAPQVLDMGTGGCTNNCEVQILAYIPTKGVFPGWFQPQGPQKTGGSSSLMTNRTAFDAMIAAARAVTGIVGLGAAVPTIP